MEEQRVAPSKAKSNFVIVANRLPVDYSGGEPRMSPGGLARALLSASEGIASTWVGWPGVLDDKLEPGLAGGVDIVPVSLSTEEFESYYMGFCNATLWPLYHDVIRSPVFHRDWWKMYQNVNRRFAEAVAEISAPGAVVWVHDYQLQLVPGLLRAMRPDLRIGFFLHIPFPPTEIFSQLPWRREILNGMLGADLVGFQTHQGVVNFSHLARRFTGAKGGSGDLSVSGRVVKVATFAVSVDSAQVVGLANSPEVSARAAQIRAELGEPSTVLLGVERLDYTKGIIQKIRAVGELLEEGALDPETTVMVQVAVPSRETDPHYEQERRDIEQLVSEINGTYGHLGRPVIHYIYRNLAFEELIALYLNADVMVITPFRDGMNLVAKEYVMARRDLSGALVLSEFAGAAEELRGAFLVNPHDLEGLKKGIRTALGVSEREGRERMSRMRRQVIKRDVYVWAEAFLGALGATGSGAGTAHGTGGE
jgi:trehalose 6-phosphate synthase